MRRASIYSGILLLTVILAGGFFIGRGQDREQEKGQEKQGKGQEPFPRIVKRLVLAQTAPIPTTVIFTPVHDGLFRVSTFTELTSPDTGSGTALCGTLNWSDDSPFAEHATLIARSGADVCVDTTGRNDQPAGETVIVIRAKAGKPVTIQTTFVNGAPPMNFSYTLFIAVEEL